MNNKKHARTSNRLAYAAPSGIDRQGLFARDAIPAGVDIVEYAGPRLPKEEGRRRAAGGNVYVFSLDRKTDIDGSVAWNLARFANHSCAPNAQSVKTAGRVWLRALRPIAKGEEVTYDYGYSRKNFTDAPCRCGADNCAGFIVQAKFRGKL
jgi:SET domain-containing protein